MVDSFQNLLAILILLYPENEHALDKYILIVLILKLRSQ